MPLCDNKQCIREATNILGEECLCEMHFLKKKVELRLQRKIVVPKEISIEFCVWMQDTDVFSTFVDHLNKGLRLEDLNINTATKPTKVLKAKA